MPLSAKATISHFLQRAVDRTWAAVPMEHS